MASWVVADAGTTAVNGTYVENGTLNGKPKYNYGSYQLGWSGTLWTISTGSPPRLYYGTGADLPANDWTTDNGTPPAPIVSAVAPEVYEHSATLSAQGTTSAIATAPVYHAATLDAEGAVESAAGLLYLHSATLDAEGSVALTVLQFLTVITAVVSAEGSGAGSNFLTRVPSASTSLWDLVRARAQ